MIWDSQALEYELKDETQERITSEMMPEKHTQKEMLRISHFHCRFSRSTWMVLKR
jgi:hypothetical protein